MVTAQKIFHDTQGVVEFHRIRLVCRHYALILLVLRDRTLNDQLAVQVLYKSISFLSVDAVTLHHASWLRWRVVIASDGRFARKKQRFDSVQSAVITVFYLIRRLDVLFDLCDLVWLYSPLVCYLIVKWNRKMHWKLPKCKQNKSSKWDGQANFVLIVIDKI